MLRFESDDYAYLFLGTILLIELITTRSNVRRLDSSRVGDCVGRKPADSLAVWVVDPGGHEDDRILGPCNFFICASRSLKSSTIRHWISFFVSDAARHIVSGTWARVAQE